MTWPRSTRRCPFCGKAWCPEEGGCGCIGERNFYWDQEDERAMREEEGENEEVEDTLHKD